MELEVLRKLTHALAPRSLTMHFEQKASKGGSKKPLSGFMLFSKEHRAKVKEDDPELSVSLRIVLIFALESSSLPLNGRRSEAAAKDSTLYDLRHSHTSLCCF